MWRIASSAWFGVALQHLGERGAVEVEVPRLLGRDLPEHGCHQRVVLGGALAVVRVRGLGGALLQRGVDEETVGIVLPVGVESLAR